MGFLDNTVDAVEKGVDKVKDTADKAAETVSDSFDGDDDDSSQSMGPGGNWGGGDGDSSSASSSGDGSKKSDPKSGVHSGPGIGLPGPDQGTQRDSTLAEADLDKEQFDPTTQEGVSRANLEGEQRSEALEQASSELNAPKDEIQFARNSEGQYLAYRDPEAAEKAAQERFEQQVAEQADLGPGQVEFAPGVNQVRLTEAGERRLKSRAQQQAAEDLDNFGYSDLETELGPGGSVSVNVKDDAIRRELTQQIQSENPNVEQSEIEFSRDDGQITATVGSEGDDTADPMDVAGDELTSLAAEASGPGDVADAVGNVGGAVVDEQLGEKFVADPRESGSVREYGGDFSQGYQEDVITVDSTEDAAGLVTDPIKVDSENFDDPASAAGDLGSYYSTETGVTRDSVSQAGQTVMSPTTGAGTSGALGTAALAGIATPEPSTTVGGLLLAGSVAGAAAVRQNRDQSGELPVSDPTQATTEVDVGGTTTEISEMPVSEGTQTSEVSVPEEPTSGQSSEVSVPDQPQSTEDPTTLQTGSQQMQKQRQTTEEEDPREVTEGDFIIVDENTIEENRQRIIREDLERQQELWEIDTNRPRQIATGESAVVDGTGMSEATSPEQAQGQRTEMGQDNQFGVGQSSRVGPLEIGVPALDTQQGLERGTDQLQDLGLQLDSPFSSETVEQTTTAEPVQTDLEFEYDYATQETTRARPPRMDIPGFGGDRGGGRRDEEGIAEGYSFDFVDPLSGETLETESNEASGIGGWL